MEDKDLEQLKKKTGDLEKKSAEYLEGWKRARAEFLNYKKEEMERIAGILKYANEEFILKMFPLIDNLEKAEKHIPQEFKDNDWVKGVLQINSKFRDFLEKEGVKEMKVVGEKFNPEFHESVGEGEGKEPGVIIEEIEKGYFINGHVLRPAKVKISK